MKTAFQIVILLIFTASAWGKLSLCPNQIRQPSWTFTIGPGTVIMVRAIDVPFIGPCYTVKYKTERGELIEIRHLQKEIPVLEGMHGLLTYSTNPDMILNFRVLK